MSDQELEIFDTGILGPEIPVSAAVKAGGFIFVGGPLNQDKTKKRTPDNR